MRRPLFRIQQRGISLFVVLVLLLLTTLILLWGSRTSLFNEKITGIDSDYQRAVEAAEAMLRDAQFDILGQQPDGQPCGTSSAAAACRTWAPTFDVAQRKLFFPTSPQELADLDVLLMAQAQSGGTGSSTTPSCVAGICAPAGVPEKFWESDKDLDAMKAAAATYGAYTGANDEALGNPLLKGSAWYWIELLPYDLGAGVISGGAAVALAPDPARPYIFRITAIAVGKNKRNRAVFREIFVLKS